MPASMLAFFVFVIKLWRVPFYNHLSVTNNSTFSDLFWSYLDDYFKVDNCLSSILKLISASKGCANWSISM